MKSRFNHGCILACYFIFLCFSTQAQLAGVIPANKYSSLTIPDSLKKDADAVIREDAMHLRIKDVNSAVLEGHEIITVLNEEGSHHLLFSEHSDKFRILDEAEIKVYNALGAKVNTYSKKEMIRVAYGEGLVEDGSTTYFNVSAGSYPVTVEFTYSVKYKGLLYYPSDYIQSPYTAVEHSIYTVDVPNDLGLRYKSKNINIQPDVQKSGDITTFTWEAKNLAAKKNEKHNGSSSRYAAQIMLAPNRFKLENYEGDMSTWKSFGEWNSKLIGGDNELSEKGKLFVKNLVKDAATDREKAATIYKYLQQNMRYVSIQLGIGGWKPFPADFVQEKKYGDCKALSNYMRAALSAVGIKSYYAIVTAGSNAEPALPDFPTSHFNHIILCIPAIPDTTWLECTSSVPDFGVLGDFTENRNAVLITENGGVLVNTPGSKSSSNIFAAKTTIALTEDGGATAETEIQTTGEFKESFIANLRQQSEDEKRKYFIRRLDWKQPDALSITTGERSEKPLTATAKMEYNQLPSFKAGSKMFLQPRLYPVFDEDVPDNDKRTQDYYFDYPYEVTDTTIFKLPEGFGAESLPAEKNVKFPFATYHCNYQWDAVGRQLQVTTSLRILQHVVKAVDYSKLVEFRKAAEQDMNEKVVVKKM